jgi:hypothetical protein
MEAPMNTNDGLLVAVEQLTVIQSRMDAIHSDGAQDGGGDGHGDAGGDGLNIAETSLSSRESSAVRAG